MLGDLSGWQIALLAVCIVIIIYLVYHWMDKSEPKSNSESMVGTAVGTASKQMSSDASVSSSKREVPFTLYNFYSPGCGHSQRFMPSWNQVANRLNNIDAISARAINATASENENLTFYYNIKDYPTVILVTPDRNVEYAGDRSPDNLYGFVMKYINEYYN